MNIVEGGRKRARGSAGAPLPLSPAGMRDTPIVHRGARTRERVERGGLDAEWWCWAAAPRKKTET